MDVPSALGKFSPKVRKTDHLSMSGIGRVTWIQGGKVESINSLIHLDSRNLLGVVCDCNGHKAWVYIESARK